MKTASSYVPLHLHSNWSLLEGASTVGEYVAAAAAMGLPALAITDTNALYGAVPFYKAAKAAGIKPLIGAEIVTGAKGANGTVTFTFSSADGQIDPSSVTTG